jgi:hypothetical protein
MIPYDSKEQLIIYKTLVDQNKFQLLEMSRRFDAMSKHLPKALAGDSYVQVDNYIKHLLDTLNACDVARRAIDKKLTEME